MHGSFEFGAAQRLMVPRFWKVFSGPGVGAGGGADAGVSWWVGEFARLNYRAGPLFAA